MNDLLYWRGCNIWLRNLSRKNLTTPAILQVAYMTLCRSLAGFFTISGLYFENYNRKFKNRSLFRSITFKISALHRFVFDKSRHSRCKQLEDL